MSYPNNPAAFAMNMQGGVNAIQNRQQSVPSTLYVGDLEEQITEEILYNHFIRFGSILSVRVMRDISKKKSRGFAFVTFYNPKDAEHAKIQANHEKILIKPIRVAWKRSIRDLDGQANVFIKNIDETVSVRDLESFFSQYGNIFSSKIATDSKGNSLGYGYIQFETAAHATSCIEKANGEQLKDLKLTVLQFTNNKERNSENVKNNLYVKNLPKCSDKTEEQINKELNEVFGQYGQITSLFVKIDESHDKRYFAFVCFANNAQAQKACDELNGSLAFCSNQNESNAEDDKLYVGWAEKKHERIKRLKEIYNKLRNENNLFTKGLKTSVTNDQLLKAYQSSFGEISSIAISAPKERESTKPSDTEKNFKSSNFGFMHFKNKDDAKKALAEANITKEITDLYENGKVYLNYHYSKDQYQQFKESQSRNLRRKQRNPMLGKDNQMLLQQMMLMSQMFPFLQPPMGHPGMMMKKGGQRMMPNGRQNMFVPNQRRYNNYNQQNYQKRQGGGPQNPQQQRQQYGGQRPQNNKGYRNNYYYQGKNTQYYQKNMGGYNQAGQQQGQQQQQQQKKDQQPKTNQNTDDIWNNTSKLSPALLKEKLSGFLTLDQDRQRVILGEMLYPLIQKLSSMQDQAGKITGMLIDFSVFEVADILEFFDNEDDLLERIKEAEQLILNPTD